MAQPKSPSEGKTSRSKKSKDQNNVGIPASTPDREANAEANAQANVQANGQANTPAVAAGTTPAEAAAELKVARAPRRMEVVKSEPRKNVVVPIKLEDEIRRRAYELYLQRGTKSGSEAEDWLTAEREVRGRYQQQRA
jgi:hypothetical protein